MADETPPYWLLISVLFSSQPLSESLAQLLYDRAYELYRRDDGEALLREELVRGTLTNLRRDALLGTISGPAFEAHIETERGEGTVRFLLTWRGIEWRAQNQDKRALN